VNAELAPLAAALYRRGIASGAAAAANRDFETAWRLAAPPPDLVDGVVRLSLEAAGAIEGFMFDGTKFTEERRNKLTSGIAARRRLKELAPSMHDEHAFWDELAYLRIFAERVAEDEAEGVDKLSGALVDEWPDQPLLLYVRARIRWWREPRDSFALLLDAVRALPPRTPDESPAIAPVARGILEVMGDIAGLIGLGEADLAPFLDVVARFGSRDIFDHALRTVRRPVDPDVVEGERMKVVSCDSGTAAPRHYLPASRMLVLDWRHGVPGARLRVSFVPPRSGRHALWVALATGLEYGTVRLTLNGTPVGKPFDGYSPGGGIAPKQYPVTLRDGENELVIELVGKNAQATGTTFGLDYVKVAD
jgi:hypothetical protein